MSRNLGRWLAWNVENAASLAQAIEAVANVRVVSWYTNGDMTCFLYEEKHVDDDSASGVDRSYKGEFNDDY